MADALPRPRRSALAVIEDPPHAFVRMAAPMVRYSKLGFRNIVRRYGADIVHTPMIIAKEFKNSSKARDAEFRTCSEDDPVVVQLAGCEALDLADAAELLAPVTSGVDLNCGCPTPSAVKHGYGAWLLSRPQHIYDIVNAIRARVSPVRLLGGARYPVSIKIRVHDDLNRTVEMCRRAERVGVDWITVHGRTHKQRSSEPVNYEAIKIIKQSVGVPVFANGNVFCVEDAGDVVRNTGADGVMAARGLLRNPSMFSGTGASSPALIWEFIEEAVRRGTLFYILHHHVMYMLETMLSKNGKRKSASIEFY